MDQVLLLPCSALLFHYRIFYYTLFLLSACTEDLDFAAVMVVVLDDCNFMQLLFCIECVFQI